MQRRKKGAFTLVELIVVIAIIAILTTVAIIGYNTYIEQANLSVDQTELRNMNNVIQLHMIQENKTEMDIHGVVKLLTEDNNFTLATKSKNYTYWFDRATNQLVLEKTDNMLCKTNCVVDDEEEESLSGGSSSITFLSTSVTYTRDEVGAIAEDPRYVLIDQSNKNIARAVNGIRNLANTAQNEVDLANKFDSFKKSVNNSTIAVVLDQFNPTKTLYVGENKMISSSHDSVTKVVFSLGITSIPKNNSSVIQINVNEIAIPSTVLFVSSGAFTELKNTAHVVTLNKKTVLFDNSFPASIINNSKLKITNISSLNNTLPILLEYSANNTKVQLNDMWYYIPKYTINLDNKAYTAVFTSNSVSNHYMFNGIIFDESGNIVGVNNKTGYITNVNYYKEDNFMDHIYNLLVYNPLFNLQTNQILEGYEDKLGVYVEFTLQEKDSLQEKHYYIKLEIGNTELKIYTKGDNGFQHVNSSDPSYQEIYSNIELIPLSEDLPAEYGYQIQIKTDEKMYSKIVLTYENLIFLEKDIK